MNLITNITTMFQNADYYAVELVSIIIIVSGYTVIRKRLTHKKIAPIRQINVFFLYHKLWKYYQPSALELLRAWFDQAMQPKGQYILLHVLDQMSEQDLARALRLMSDEEKKQWSIYLSQDKSVEIPENKMLEAKNQMLNDVLNVFGLTQNDQQILLYEALVAQDMDGLARCIAACPKDFCALIQILPPNLIQTISQKIAAKEYATMLEAAMAINHQTMNKNIATMIERLNVKMPVQENSMHQKLLQLYHMSSIEREVVLLKQIYHAGGDALLQNALVTRLPFETLLSAPREVLTEAFSSMSVKERARLLVGLGKERGESMLRKCFPKSVSGYQRFLTLEIERIQMDIGQIEACQNEISFAWPKFLRAVDRAWVSMSGQEDQRSRLQKMAMSEITEFVPSKIHLEF